MTAATLHRSPDQPPDPRRRAGVLLHPTSLPEFDQSGALGTNAFRFVDWLAAHGQTLWQMLPVGPPGYGGSPYASHSSIAGDERWISPAGLVELGLLPSDEPIGSQRQALEKAWQRFDRQPPKRAQTVVARTLDDRVQRTWIDDWALYLSLKSAHGDAAWIDWDPKLARRAPKALERAQRKAAKEIARHQFTQAILVYQWGQLRERAHRQGVLLFGDQPIYAAHDSVDVWSSQHLFELDRTGRPISVSGVPPDGFTDDGQLWGQPLYDWSRMAEEGYRWWLERIRAHRRRFDLLRIDHFRGLVDYWAVPAEAETAASGDWRPGPRRALFDALGPELRGLQLVAEDLGVITDEVENLRRSLGLPGMRVLQFGFDRDSPHSPEQIQSDHFAYTATHDNLPTRAWYQDLRRSERQVVRQVTGSSGYRPHRDLAAAAFHSKAQAAILPMQDVLGLRHEGTMNRPGTAVGNWSWRLTDWPPVRKTQWLADLTKASTRGTTA